MPNENLTKEEQEIVERICKKFEELFTPDESFEDAVACIRKMGQQNGQRERTLSEIPMDLFEDGEEE